MPADRAAEDRHQPAVVATEVGDDEDGGASAAPERVVGERGDGIDRQEEWQTLVGEVDGFHDSPSFLNERVAARAAGPIAVIVHMHELCRGVIAGRCFTERTVVCLVLTLVQSPP